MNKWLTGHEQVVTKLKTSCEQVVDLAKTTILGVCCIVYAAHEQVMNKL